MDLIMPDWPAPDVVQACFTTRAGGVSQGVYAGLNVGAHVGDEPAAVANNRQQLQHHLQLAQMPLWLNQVHGTDVYELLAGAYPVQPPTADAAVCRVRGAALSVMTADCLPVLFCDTEGRVVASAHAGWRGLCHGVLEKTVTGMAVEPAAILAWLGPAIGPEAFEVGDDVRQAFVGVDSSASTAFVALGGGKWLANLYLLARQRLNRIGVQRIYGGDLCTYSDRSRFYSYRRDGQTGRMTGLIWLAS